MDKNCFWMTMEIPHRCASCLPSLFLASAYLAVVEVYVEVAEQHNLAPTIAQVNRLRLTNRYADLPKKTSDFGKCEIEDMRGFFEPPDCHKGDVARVWFYMAERYGVVIPPPGTDHVREVVDDGSGVTLGSGTRATYRGDFRCTKSLCAGENS